MLYNKIMRNLFILSVILLSAVVSGCADRSEVNPSTYGKVVSHLPKLEDAEKPFVFPHAGDNDHRNCEFKPEDYY